MTNTEKGQTAPEWEKKLNEQIDQEFERQKDAIPFESKSQKLINNNLFTALEQIEKNVHEARDSILHPHVCFLLTKVNELIQDNLRLRAACDEYLTQYLKANMRRMLLRH